MDNNPRWLVGSTARNRYSGNEYLVEQEYGEGAKYFLAGLGWRSREFLNTHYIISRVANWPPAPAGGADVERA